MMLSVVALTVFAEDSIAPYSNRDLYFFETAPISTSFAQTDTGEKENDTPAWLRIDSMTGESRVRVRIVGSWVKGHACGDIEYNSSISGVYCRYCTRCTARGTWVPYVLCTSGVNYAVSSTVYETFNSAHPGSVYSSVGFQSTSLQQKQSVSGYWSADSTGYPNYEKPEKG